MDRRLSAILLADVVGYSRAMATDEAATLAALSGLRRTLIEPLIAAHRGRVVKLMGDGILVEFASVVDAVTCAVNWQSGIGDGALQFRIGVNLGEVIAQDGDIYGNGVNVAARLETLAQPGGVCVSGIVHGEVKNRLDLDFDDLGEQSVKNIPEPVRAYRILQRNPTAPKPAVPAAPAPAPDKPAIAVLPFTNMSGDPEQEYFSDGLTEDIITELSRFRSLSVVARNSSFAFKGGAVDMKQAGASLGVQYLVEGSIRKAGNRVRVTCQLIDAASTNHIWAERYDRDLEDIFAVQDDLVRAIAGAIPGHLNRLAVEGSRRKAPGNLTAYDCELRGRWALAHWNEGLGVALDWYQRSVEADPDYALAHAGMAVAYAYGIYVLGLSPDTAITRAKFHATRACALDDRNPTVHAYAGFAYHVAGEHKLTRAHAARAVALNPNDPFALYVQAAALSYTGAPEEAREWIARSEQLEPFAPDDQRLDTLCDIHYMLREYERVIEIHAVYQNVPAFLYLILAAAHAQTGDIGKAQTAVAQYERLRPPKHDARTMIESQIRMLSRTEDREHWLEGYRKAGIDV